MYENTLQSAPLLSLPKSDRATTESQGKQTKTEEQAERLEEVSRSRGTGRDTGNEEEMNLEP